MVGAIAYGISVHAESYSLHGWKILFVVVGLMTVVVGVTFYFHIPDTPAQARFLSDEEKLIVIERIRSNQQGFGNKNFKKTSVDRSLIGYQHLVLLLFCYCF